MCLFHNNACVFILLSKHSLFSVAVFVNGNYIILCLATSIIAPPTCMWEWLWAESETKMADHDYEEPEGKENKSQLEGGYECSFAENFPNDFDSECPICLHILREPYIVGCCGYRFCRSCIDPVQSSTGHCPLCKLSFSSLPDKHLERLLNDRVVYCSYKEEGCEWKDKLRALEEHLKTCALRDVSCSFCASLFRKSAVKDHEETCPLRVVLCAHCKEHSATLSELESEHYPKCPMYPVACPNNCGASLCRKDLAEHVDNVCPNTVLDCFFRHIGCEVQLPRKELTKHSNEKLSEHLVASKKEIKKLRQVNTELLEENETLKTENARLMRQLEDCGKSHPPPPGHSFTYMPAESPEQSCGSYILAVTNLPPAVTESMLKSLFGRYGRVEDVSLSDDRKWGRVVYTDQRSAEQVLSLSRKRKIELKTDTVCHVLCIIPEQSGFVGFTTTSRFLSSTVQFRHSTNSWKCFWTSVSKPRPRLSPWPAALPLHTSCLAKYPLPNCRLLLKYFSPSLVCAQPASSPSSTGQCFNCRSCHHYWLHTTFTVATPSASYI